MRENLLIFQIQSGDREMVPKSGDSDLWGEFTDMDKVENYFGASEATK